MKKLLKTFVAILTLIAIGSGLLYYWHYSDLHPSTENAYVHAKIISIAPQVSGRITKISVDDYQFVHAGDHLLSIDPASYILAVKEAQAGYQEALQKNKSQDSGINAAIAQLNEAKANLEHAQKTFSRTISLVNKQILSTQKGDTDRTALVDAQARLHAAQANLQQAIDARGGQGQDSAQVQQAAARLGHAELNLSYTEINAPFDGYVGSIEVHVGSLAATGQPLFPVVKQYSQWIQANFKESQMVNIKQGQPVNITLDMYPEEQWQGKVALISPASGTSFSLIPPENATGNWVKVGQRFPIKITLTDDLSSKPLLRVGASTQITIDTTVEE